MCELEQKLKDTLDGNFYSFIYKINGNIVIENKKVSKDYLHEYNFENQFQRATERFGRYSRTNRAIWAASRRLTFWTEEKVTELTQHHKTGYSARRIGRMIGIGRFEVGLKLNELGLRSRYGLEYQS